MTIIANNPQDFFGRISGAIGLITIYYNIFAANISFAFLQELSVIDKAIVRGVLWIPSDGNDQRFFCCFVFL